MAVNNPGVSIAAVKMFRDYIIDYDNPASLMDMARPDACVPGYIRNFPRETVQNSYTSGLQTTVLSRQYQDLFSSAAVPVSAEKVKVSGVVIEKQLLQTIHR